MLVFPFPSPCLYNALALALCLYNYLSSPKSRHTKGGSGRGDAKQNMVPTFRWPWKPTAPLALQRTVNNWSERLCKPNGGTKPAVDPRFITGLSVVYHRDRHRSSLLAVDQWTEAYLFLKNLFMQGMSGKFCYLSFSFSFNFPCFF